jgi:hypothetical protein
MLQTKQIKARKEKSFLIFTDLCENKEIVYDLSDNTFKKFLKSGKLSILADTGVQKFFRGVYPKSAYKMFEGTAFEFVVKTMLEQQRNIRENANFATIFSKITNYIHLESYFLLDIKLETSGYLVNHPVNLYSKPVIRFMKESGFSFSNRWEDNYIKNPKLLTDLCNYVVSNYHDDLNIYRYLLEIFQRNYGSFNKFNLLVKPVSSNNDSGYGADYKSLFDYVVKCVAVEAMTAIDVIDEYHDYLRMSKRIKELNSLAKLRESGDNDAKLEDLHMIGYSDIEKYPKGLTIRHRIVNRNYNLIQQKYDDEKFKSLVNYNYEWENGEYAVVAPKSTGDIKSEGSNLNHCVGSYIDSVLNGRTQILFMRKTDNLEESYVTLEIRSRQIQQARGRTNRDVTFEERMWLEKYAKAKNISYGNNYSNNELECPTPNSISV